MDPDLPYVEGPLLWILEGMQEALPPELRAVYEPLAHKLANVLRSDALVPTMRRLLALLGSSLSHLATELLCDAMRLESGVRAERLFELEGEIGAASDRPPRRVEHPEVGQMVRVLIAEAAAHPHPGCSAGLFRARIHAEEPPSHSGMAPTYVIEYVDEVALVAGNSCVGAEYHIFDYIPELRCHWLLWLRGLQVDLKMPVIRATWHEPTAAEREAGQMGALTLHARIAHVHVRARVERGRFWSDNPLLHVGSFEGLVLESTQGSVNVSLRYTFEADGCYFAIEELKLGIKDISVVAAPGHGQRVGLLLHTWNLQRWMFDSWVEQLLLRLIEQIMPKPQLPSPNKTPNKTPPLEARAAVPVGIPEGPLWEFEDGWGNWHPYPSEVNVALRTAGAYEYTALNGATYEVVLSPQKLSGTQTNKATHHTRNVRSVGTPVAISLPASLGAESSSRDPAEAPTTAPTPAPAEHDGDEAPPPAACDPLMADGGGDADSPRRGVVDYARKWLWRAPGSVDSLRKRTGTKPR
ncbi:hypothetical protein Ctob_012944 [Chrysochromulina tobinii]|uniref:WWE domain-containing protein n=1 Tax=Chrysochromulina tobinii TaxID=1460289 RepID=A0A0M0JZU5_9EUKA|nr:hypothetical protein Ctob_012944 [Chrysochromulina tobinii]|eukprot:KOO31857.1 hypothetical protein Ctob_012944 [Chrysochromulina sp. CCMP291]